MARYLYSEIANAVQSRLNCIRSNNQEWQKHHTDRIEAMVSDYMPSGSGFDSGTKIDLDRSHGDKLVFTTAFHHMNEGGFYDGWTEHTVTVTPSFIGHMNIRVSGRNRNDIKTYIADEFALALEAEITEAN